MTRPVCERDVVLVVANDSNGTADGVCAVLAKREQSYFRFNAADVPGRLLLDLRLDVAGDPGPSWSGTLHRNQRTDGNRSSDQGGLAEVDLSQVVSIYMRRPQPFAVPAHLTVAERWHAATECRYGLGG